ncbi:hypothetical protein KSP39_PZI024253 [Platanthera zijinensis]|uniref:Uncharacterized protein n=1 Tax=Platanthera zijinensis TaxID=2320716 RepID=A0AAP0FTV4_9ASPA
MEEAWHAKCSSGWPVAPAVPVFPPLAAGSCNQINVNGQQFFHPDVMQAANLGNSQLLQEPLLPCIINKDLRKSGNLEAGNSFLSLLSGRSNYLSGELLPPLNPSSELSKLPISDREAFRQSSTCSFSSNFIPPLSKYHCNDAIFNGVLPSFAASRPLAADLSKDLQPLVPHSDILGSSKAYSRHSSEDITRGIGAYSRGFGLSSPSCSAFLHQNNQASQNLPSDANVHDIISPLLFRDHPRNHGTINSVKAYGELRRSGELKEDTLYAHCPNFMGKISMEKPFVRATPEFLNTQRLHSTSNRQEPNAASRLFASNVNFGARSRNTFATHAPAGPKKNLIHGKNFSTRGSSSNDTPVIDGNGSDLRLGQPSQDTHSSLNFSPTAINLSLPPVCFSPELQQQNKLSDRKNGDLHLLYAVDFARETKRARLNRPSPLPETSTSVRRTPHPENRTTFSLHNSESEDLLTKDSSISLFLSHLTGGTGLSDCSNRTLDVPSIAATSINCDLLSSRENLSWCTGNEIDEIGKASSFNEIHYFNSKGKFPNGVSDSSRNMENIDVHSKQIECRRVNRPSIKRQSLHCFPANMGKSSLFSNKPFKNLHMGTDSKNSNKNGKMAILEDGCHLSNIIVRGSEIRATQCAGSPETSDAACKELNGTSLASMPLDAQQIFDPSRSSAPAMTEVSVEVNKRDSQISNVNSGTILHYSLFDEGGSSNIKQKRSDFPSSKFVSLKKLGDKILLSNNVHLPEESKNSVPVVEKLDFCIHGKQDPVKRLNHLNDERPRKYMSLSSIVDSRSHESGTSTISKRPVVCGNSGIISSGDLYALQKSPKIVPVDLILKKARRCTINGEVEPKTSLISKMNCTGVKDQNCSKFSSCKSLDGSRSPYFGRSKVGFNTPFISGKLIKL